MVETWNGENRFRRTWIFLVDHFNYPCFCYQSMAAVLSGFEFWRTCFFFTRSCWFFLYITNLPRAPPDLVEQCEGLLTYEEAFEAIKLMKNGKTPDSDGLPAEFYKQFFPSFGQDFVSS